MQDWAQSGFKSNYVYRNLKRVFAAEAKGLSMTQGRLTLYAQRAVKGAIATERIYRSLGITKHNVTVEERFDIAFPGRAEEGHRMIGFTDVYDQEAQALYDLKMYTSTSETPNIEQLYTYAVAQRKRGLPVVKAAYLLPLLPKPIQAFKVTTEHVDYQEDQLSKALDHMEEGVSPVATTGYYCWFCEFRNTENCPESRSLRRK